MLFAIPPNTENSLTIRTQMANQLQSSWSLVGRRLFALALDSIVVGFLSQTLFVLVTAGLAAGQHTPADLAVPLLLTAFVAGAFDSFTGCVLLAAICAAPALLFLAPSALAHMLSNPIGWVLCVICALITNYAYHVLFEVFSLGTPAKRLMGLQVARSNGARADVFQATCRHFTKFLSTFTMLALPLLWIVLCNRRQMVHDRIASTMVDVNNSPLLQSNGGAALEVATKTSQPIVSNCAGIPRRVVSAIIDSIIYYVCEGLATVAAVELVATYVPLDLGWFPYPFDGVAVGLIAFAATLPAMLFPIFLIAAFEASPLQASPGKIIMGMRVTSLTGNRCTFMQALQKQFIQCLVYLTFLPISVLGLILVANSNQKELSLLVGWFLFYLVYGAILCWTNKNNQTLIDRWSKRYVVLEPSSQDHVPLLNSGGASK
jgi:uncharacterized RDD family membrane protein YckC